MVPLKRMSFEELLTVILLVLQAFFVDHQLSNSHITPTPPTRLASSSASLVTQVIDGDTIKLSTGERVRYIGIDTPELSASNGDTCFATQASQINRNLVLGKEVTLVSDVSSTDRFGRLLRYVYLRDKTFVNSVLVKNGAARAKKYPPDVAHFEQFTQDEQYARQNNLGLWSECVR